MTLRNLAKNDDIVLALIFLPTTVVAFFLFGSELLMYISIGLCVGNFFAILIDKKMSLGFNNGIILMGISITLTLLIFLIHEILEIIEFIGVFSIFIDHNLHIDIMIMFLYYSQSFLASSLIVGQLMQK